MKRILSIVMILVLVLSCSASFAAVNPAVTIVNPANAGSISSDNLLVSVKIENAATIKVSVNELMKPAASEGTADTAISLEEYEANLQATAESKISWNSRAVMEAETVSYTASLSYYTKKLENITPGVYLVNVDTLDASGKVLYTNSSYVEVKAKSDAPQSTAGGNNSGALQFLKTLLTSIFGK